MTLKFLRVFILELNNTLLMGLGVAFVFVVLVVGVTNTGSWWCISGIILVAVWNS